VGTRKPSASSLSSTLETVPLLRPEALDTSRTLADVVPSGRIVA
jgi:hypothetical protein